MSRSKADSNHVRCVKSILKQMTLAKTNGGRRICDSVLKILPPCYVVRKDIRHCKGWR